MEGIRKNKEKDCLFCNIVSGEESSTRVYEDDLCMAFMDVYPLTPGHLLVVPKRHVVRWDELNEPEAAHLGKITRQLSESMMRSSLAPDGYNCMINNGKAANQHVPHLHFHIIPRYRGDVLKVGTKLLLQVPGIFLGRASIETLEQHRDQIYAALGATPGI